MEEYRLRTLALLNSNVICEKACQSSIKTFEYLQVKYSSHNLNTAMIMHFIMAFERVCSREQLIGNESHCEEIANSKHFNTSLNEVEYIQKITEMEFNKTELVFIIMHITCFLQQ